MKTTTMRSPAILLSGLSTLVALVVSLPAIPAGGARITFVTPVQGPAGTTIRIQGKDFGTHPTRRVVISNNRTPSDFVVLPITRWSASEITATIPREAATGPSQITVMTEWNSSSSWRGTNAVNFNVMVPTISVQPLPGRATPIKPLLPAVAVRLPPGKCPDPAVSLRVGWPARNTDGTYTFRLLALITNVGGATYHSSNRQQTIVFSEGGRVLASQPWPSRAYATITLAPGEGAPSAVYLIQNWNPSSEFLADFTVQLSYDPDILLDGNPQNDDCVATNNRARLTVDDVRRQLPGLSR